MGIGRVDRGVIRQNQDVYICNYHTKAAPVKTRIVSLQQFDGLGRRTVESALPGDIVCFSGAESITIGDTITSLTCPEPLEFVRDAA